MFKNVINTMIHKILINKIKKYDYEGEFSNQKLPNLKSKPWGVEQSFVFHKSPIPTWKISNLKP